jgi:hypothetical protein
MRCKSIPFTPRFTCHVPRRNACMHLRDAQEWNPWHGSPQTIYICKQERKAIAECLRRICIYLREREKEKKKKRKKKGILYVYSVVDRLTNLPCRGWVTATNFTHNLSFFFFFFFFFFFGMCVCVSGVNAMQSRQRDQRYRRTFCSFLWPLSQTAPHLFLSP